jgi:hypothetical protein
VRATFQRKCEVKGLAIPSSAGLVSIAESSKELQSEWRNMLAHQLPALPEVGAVLARLAASLGWIDVEAGVAPGPILGSAFVGSGAAPPLVAAGAIRYWGTGAPIEALRFAGANRLMVVFDYHGQARLVEPYSLRQPATGNLLVCAWEVQSRQVKAFKVAEMRGVRVVDRSFQPRYRVEL